MKKRKSSARSIFTIVGILVIIILVAVVSVIIRKNTGPAFVLPDKTVSQSEVELCSPYANICFTRPTNWTRSSILHVDGSKQNTVEINPPTGTILEFAKSSNDTATNCDKRVYKECIIKTSKVISLQNNLKVVTGMLIDSPDANCTDQCSAPKYTPFAALVSDDDFNKYKLGNDTSTFNIFNPIALFKNGRGVYFLVTPGKAFNVDEASRWQNSPEANTAQQILKSARLYK